MLPQERSQGGWFVPWGRCLGFNNRSRSRFGRRNGNPDDIPDSEGIVVQLSEYVQIAGGCVFVYDRCIGVFAIGCSAFDYVLSLDGGGQQ